MQTKRVLFLIVCVAVLVAGSLLAGKHVTAQDPAVSFKTPEDAIKFYMQGVAQGDASTILQACAIDEMSEKVDFAAYIDRLGGVFSPITFQAPAQYPLYAESNRAQFTSQTLLQVRLFAYSLLSTEVVDPGKMITKFDAERVAKFLADVDPKRLSGISAMKVEALSKKMATSQYITSMNNTARVYGADESTERVVLFSFEGNTYIVGFTLYRYGDNWKISRAASPMSGLNSYGTAAKISEADFDKLVSGN